MQVAAGERRTAAHVVVGVDEQHGQALVQSAQTRGQARSARAEHDDVGLVVPRDVVDRGRVTAHRVAVGHLDVVVDVGQGGPGQRAGQRKAGRGAGAAQAAAAGDGF